MSRRKGKNGRHIIARMCLVLYGIAMFWLMFGQRVGLDSYGAYLQQQGLNWNLKPFETIKLYLSLLQSADGGLVRHAWINLVGNVVMFIPMGYLLPNIWKKLRKVYKTVLMSIAIVFVAEVLQYITGLGSFDIDDFILNCVGITLGYGMWRIINK